MIRPEEGVHVLVIGLFIAMVVAGCIKFRYVKNESWLSGTIRSFAIPPILLWLLLSVFDSIYREDIKQHSGVHKIRRIVVLFAIIVEMLPMAHSVAVDCISVPNIIGVSKERRSESDYNMVLGTIRKATLARIA